MVKARRIINTPKLLYTVIKNINRQKKFIKNNIEPVIRNAKKSNDGSLDEADLKKITSYYGLAVPAILGEALCALRGRKMTEKERLASTCQGATTGLFDDFFDKQNLSGEALKGFIENPQQLSGANANQQLFLTLYTTGLRNLPDLQLTLSYVYRVYSAQVESKKQALPGLSYDEIKTITLLKGGVSLLLYRTAFANPMEKAEEDMLHKLGGLMQLSNDIFDVYEDRQHKISTLITTAKKINDIRTVFMALLKEGYVAAYESNYPPHNVKRFLNMISIGIFSRCLVCLDQLEENEKRSGNIFTPHLYSRKELVCDMDTTANKWRSVKYHVRTIC
jgi:hypothetical protein